MSEEQVTFPELGKLEDLARRLSEEGARSKALTAEIQRGVSRAGQVVSLLKTRIDELQKLFVAVQDVVDPGRSLADRQETARAFGQIQGGVAGLSRGLMLGIQTGSPVVGAVAAAGGLVGGVLLGGEAIDNQIAAGQVAARMERETDASLQATDSLLKEIRERDRAWQRVKSGAR